LISAAAALKLLSPTIQENLQCSSSTKTPSQTIQEHLQCSSSTKTPVSNNTGKITVLQKQKNSCLQQYREIYSAATALKHLSPTIQEHLQCSSSTKPPVSNNKGKFTVLQQH
jgi:hypothetical protein